MSFLSINSPLFEREKYILLTNRRPCPRRFSRLASFGVVMSRLACTFFCVPVLRHHFWYIYILKLHMSSLFLSRKRQNKTDHATISCNSLQNLRRVIHVRWPWILLSVLSLAYDPADISPVAKRKSSWLGLLVLDLQRLKCWTSLKLHLSLRH